MDYQCCCVEGGEHEYDHNDALSRHQRISNTIQTRRKIRVIAAHSGDVLDLDAVAPDKTITVRDVLLRFPPGHFLASFDADAEHTMMRKLASPLNPDAQVLAAPNTVYVLFPDSRLHTRVMAREYTQFACLIDMEELHAVRQSELEKEEKCRVPASPVLRRSTAKRYCCPDLADCTSQYNNPPDPRWTLQDSRAASFRGKHQSSKGQPVKKHLGYRKRWKPMLESIQEEEEEEEEEA
ncbi:hypothetical protein KP509_08G058300 [Ceratopteris richardii]|uniref:Uncharacterized protein n=1 Tax=Ceratopteris richardii TaxID=49495 RepID=A0A8T2UDM0_CERRI|nr:hypothetical protein KP509_08G058300 [Ceratopteris richardii]